MLIYDKGRHSWVRRSTVDAAEACKGDGYSMTDDRGNGPPGGDSAAPTSGEIPTDSAQPPPTDKVEADPVDAGGGDIRDDG